jgi:hypothetical protein
MDKRLQYLQMLILNSDKTKDFKHAFTFRTHGYWMGGL